MKKNDDFKVADISLAEWGIKEIKIADIKVKALRINYIGELGWELHHSFKDMENLYDQLMSAGKKYNISNFGTYAVNSLRLEKAYKGWEANLQERYL